MSAAITVGNTVRTYAHEPPHFDLVQVFTFAAPAYGLAAADVDGDGRKDFAVSFDGTDVVQIYRQTTPLNWVFSQQLDVGRPNVFSQPTELAFANVVFPTAGADTALDLIVVLTNDQRVEILPGSSNGIFSAVGMILTVADAAGNPVKQPAGLAVYDWDNNGQVDIAVAGFQDFDGTPRPTLGVLWGEPDATFQKKAHRLTTETNRGADLALYNANAPAAFIAAPPRIAMTNTHSFRLHTFRYTTARTFAATSGNGFPSRGVAAGDFNGDGLDDLGSTFGSNSLGWYLRSGQGFIPTDYFNLANDAIGVASGFLNRTSAGFIENSVDLVSAVGAANAIAISVNTGGAAQVLFSEDATYWFDVNPGTPTFPRQVLVTDLNNDGFPDILVASANAVSVMINVWP